MGASPNGTCIACGATLEFPCACGGCGALQPEGAARDPWSVLGLAPDFDIDAAALRKRLLRASRLVHPDFHGAEPAARALAELHSARLNGAHEILADEARRADALLALLGGPDEGAVREMPREFLVEVLEWNEALEEARAAQGWSDAVARLRDELAARRAAELAAVRALLVPPPAAGSPDLAVVRSRLNAVRYLDRALGDIEALRLASAR